jgi:hypothetical protein
MDGAKLISDLNKKFADLGTKGSTAMPQIDGMKNTEHLAYELMVAGVLRSAAGARYDAAKEAAKEAGVLGDETDAVPGTKKPVYEGMLVLITRQVNKPAQRLDSKKLITELRKAGVAADVIDKAIRLSTVEATAAKVYEAMPR